MSEESKKVENTEQEAKAAELSEQDLSKVAGGFSVSSGGDRPSEIVVTKPLQDTLVSGF
jgi:hypothetical protein